MIYCILQTNPELTQSSKHCSIPIRRCIENSSGLGKGGNICSDPLHRMSHIQPPGQWSVPVSSHFPRSTLPSLHSVPVTELLHAHDGTCLDKQPHFLVMKTFILCRGMPQICVFSGLRMKDHKLFKINEC